MKITIQQYCILDAYGRVVTDDAGQLLIGTNRAKGEWLMQAIEKAKNIAGVYVITEYAPLVFDCDNIKVTE